MHRIRLDNRKTFLVINRLKLIRPEIIIKQFIILRARRPSTMNSLFPLDNPQNSMVGQQRQQISELQFDNFLTPSTFLCCFPSEAMLWIKEVEMVDSINLLERIFSDFETLDARIASALNKLIQNSQFKKKVSLEEEPRKRTVFFKEDRSPS